MARINYEPALQQAPVTAPAPKERKRKRPLRRRIRRGCCLLLFLGVFFSGLIGTAAFAKTGIWSVPGFSNIFYRLPQPERTIKINDAATYRPEGTVVSDSTKPERMKLEITEKDLTYFLRQSFTGKTDSYLAGNLQAVIADGEIELFALLLKPVKVNLTVRLLPVLADNQLSYTLTEFTLGNLSLPPAWGQRFFDQIFKAQLDSLNLYISKNFTIYQLASGDGKLVAELGVNQQLLDQYLKLINLSR